MAKALDELSDADIAFQLELCNADQVSHRTKKGRYFEAVIYEAIRRLKLAGAAAGWPVEAGWAVKSEED